MDSYPPPFSVYQNQPLLDNYKIFLIPIPDIHNFSIYGSHVISLLPKFDLIYSNNPVIRIIFGKLNIPVKKIPFSDRKSYSGSNIRKKMVLKQEWEHLVPIETKQFIKTKKIDHLLRELNLKDY